MQRPVELERLIGILGDLAAQAENEFAGVQGKVGGHNIEARPIGRLNRGFERGRPLVAHSFHLGFAIEVRKNGVPVTHLRGIDPKG